VASEYLVGGAHPSRMRVLAGRVVAVRALVDGAPFVEGYRLLTGEYGFAPSTAFTICMRVYRSGGLTKDAIYLRGLQDFLAYLRAGRDLEPLLLGKLAIADVPAIEELRWREYLKPPRLIPRFSPRLERRARCERCAGALTPQLVTEDHAMKIGFVVNDLETEIDNYTTTRLALTALSMGHESWYIGVADFGYDQDATIIACAARRPAGSTRRASRISRRCGVRRPWWNGSTCRNSTW
jgi:hypothetical protein